MNPSRDPLPNTISAVSLSVCATILVFAGVRELTGHDMVSLISAAIAGGYVLGRLRRTVRDSQRSRE